MEPPQTRTNPTEPSLLLFSSDGTLVRKVAFVSVFSWLPDSSGLFVAITIPQRAPDLSIVELDGRLVATQVQLADETLTRDGKWIVAEHQEGCCVSIVQREIRVSSRDGRVTRTLVRSEATEPQPIALVGVDATDRVVYRDVDRLMRVPLAGGTPAVIASSPDLVRTVGASTSPDGAAMLVRGYQPDRWFMVANDSLGPWDPAQGEPVADLNVSLMKSSPAALWIGPHTLLVRAPDGTLSAYDAVTGARSAFAARLASNDTVVTYGHGAVLLLRGRQPVLIDLATGAVRESGLDAGSEARAVSSSALADGGFLLSTASSTYRLD
jgi:hypothetical protein